MSKALLYRRLVEEQDQSVILRPVGWNATSDEGAAYLRRLHSPGFVWRAMTSEEFNATVGAGKYINSTRAYSHSSEGISFADNPEDAESYVNFGRDDPRKTGKPTWLVMAKRTEGMYQDRDWYIKSKEPVAPAKVWIMYPHNGAILISPFKKQELPKFESFGFGDYKDSYEFKDLMIRAKNPATSSSELRSFVFDGLYRSVVGKWFQPDRIAFIKAIASNPNSPPEVLTQLVKDAPAEVGNNPSLFLLSLENPRFVTGLIFRATGPHREPLLAALRANGLLTTNSKEENEQNWGKQPLFESAPTLWLRPQQTQQIDLLGRYQHNAHFIRTMTEYSQLRIPAAVPVTWRVFSEFPERLVLDTPEEAREESAYIRSIAKLMKAGADLPPLIVSGGRPFDGQHRAIAAKQLGIKLAPVVDITPYWK